MKPKIEIRDSVRLDMDIDRAWEMLSDLPTVVSCMPGAEVTSTELDEQGALHGALSLSLGPSTSRFEGRITPTFDEEAKTGHLQGQGADGRGRTRAMIDTSFKLEAVEGDPNRTDLVIDSSITVSGALAGFAMTGGQTVARTLLADFADNIVGLQQADRDPAGGESAESSSSGPRRLGVAGLLVRAVRDAVGRVFGRNRDRTRN